MAQPNDCRVCHCGEPVTALAPVNLCEACGAALDELSAAVSRSVLLTLNAAEGEQEDDEAIN
jgi:hypothetical protein